MFKNFVSLILILLCLSGWAQTDENGWGIKAGLSQNTNGELKNLSNDAKFEAEAGVGYHIGVFGNINLSPIYLRPELIYTKTQSEYEGVDFELQRLDIPVLVGLKLIGPLHVFAGPNLQYNLDSKFGNKDLEKPNEDWSLGLHAGAGVQLGDFGIDLRYSRGFSDNEVEFLQNNFDNTPELNRLNIDQSELILSLSFKF
jgi:hypothetical protein